MVRASLAAIVVSVAIVACANGNNGDVNPVFQGDDDAGLVDVAQDVGHTIGKDAALDAADAGVHDASEGGFQGDAAACNVTLDFETDNGGFTHQAADGFGTSTAWPYDDWAWGDATDGTKCHSGTKCWDTYLTGNYAQCGRGVLRSRSFSLAACKGATSVKLVFWHSYDFWTGSGQLIDGNTYYDGAIVEISGDGNNWGVPQGLTTTGTIKLNMQRGIASEYKCDQGDGGGDSEGFYVDGKRGFTASSSGYQKVELQIPPELRTDNFQVRFTYGAGVSSPSFDPSRDGTAAGWHIDDVQIVTGDVTH